MPIILTENLFHFSGHSGCVRWPGATSHSQSQLERNHCTAFKCLRKHAFAGADVRACERNINMSADVHALCLLQLFVNIFETCGPLAPRCRYCCMANTSSCNLVIHSIIHGRDYELSQRCDDCTCVVLYSTINSALCPSASSPDLLVWSPCTLFECAYWGVNWLLGFSGFEDFLALVWRNRL